MKFSQRTVCFGDPAWQKFDLLLYICI